MTAMTLLSRHPKTGTYYYRRAVPLELREAIGKGREWKETLRTKDVREAKRFASEVNVRVEDAFDRARKGEEAFDKGTDVVWITVPGRVPQVH